MALNRVIEQGRIPSFENALKIYNEGDDKKAVLNGQISVRRNYKKQEDEYYPEDLLDFKAFGVQANFINKYFSKGDNILLEGELRRNDNYEKDGETVYGQMYIHVTSVNFQQGNGEKSEGKKSGGAKPNAQKPTPSKSKGSNPLAGAKKQSIL